MDVKCVPFFAENIVASILRSNIHFGELQYKQKQQVCMWSFRHFYSIATKTGFVDRMYVCTELQDIQVL